jgi:hypothetical protein
MTKISEKDWGKNWSLFFYTSWLYVDRQSSQKASFFLCAFDADLRLCANGTFHSKLDKNDPYGSNLRKNSPKMYRLNFPIYFLVKFLGTWVKILQIKFWSRSTFISRKKYWITVWVQTIIVWNTDTISFKIWCILGSEKISCQFLYMLLFHWQIFFWYVIWWTLSANKLTDCGSLAVK